MTYIGRPASGIRWVEEPFGRCNELSKRIERLASSKVRLCFQVATLTQRRRKIVTKAAVLLRQRSTSPRSQRREERRWRI